MGGGGCGWTCSSGGRGRGASTHQRAAPMRATEQYGHRAPHDPPVTTAHSGRAEGGFRSAGDPGGAVHGAPLTPCHPGAALRPRPHAHAGREWTDDTRGANTAGRHPEGEQGGRGTTPPPPHPPTGPQAAGAPAPSPRGRGDGPPPARERSQSAIRPCPSRRLPRGPRRTSEPAPTRQDAAKIAPREGG